jgi:hypothetical protein
MDVREQGADLLDELGCPAEGVLGIVGVGDARAWRGMPASPAAAVEDAVHVQQPHGPPIRGWRLVRHEVIEQGGVDRAPAHAHAAVRSRARRERVLTGK